MVTVQIDAEANAVIEEYCRTRDKKKRNTVSRIVKWFVTRPAQLQTVILGVHDKMEEAYAAWLESEAKRLRGEASDLPPLGKVSATTLHGELRVDDPAAAKAASQAR